MIWLTIHMWLLIAITFLAGLGAGWWIWGSSASPADAPSKEDMPMGSLNLESPRSDNIQNNPGEGASRR